MGKPYASPPLFLEPPSSLNLDNKINPSILYIIIILAIIFSVSALLHLLLRCYLRQTGNNLDHERADVTALQGQLRQLFHLHDAGVDQLYIDTLPVFPYKAIIGVKDPFDCAVCLCEFEDEDKLRLLPKCSHAFHMDCIDTWLLSHSTCPLCRSSIIHDYNDCGGNGFPFVCVLESGSVEPSREIRESGSDELDSQVEFGSGQVELERKSLEVKLGKLKNEDDLNNGRIMDKDVSRRCYSMGSFAYVMDEKTLLQVPINTLMKKQRDKKPRHRVAKSEYGFDSRRYFNGNGNEKRESFSVSKIWQRGERNKKGNDCSSRRTISEIEIEIDEGELRGDEDIQSCYSIDSSTNHVGSTSHRRTLLWLMGKHNKVVHNHISSISSNV